MSCVFSFMLHESERVLAERMSAQRGKSLPDYVRWLVNRWMLEEGRPLLPSPRIIPRDWPSSIAMPRKQFYAAKLRLTQECRPASELVRALIHDDARRCGVMFSPDWRYGEVTAST